MANGIRQTNAGVVTTSSGVAQTVTTGAGLTIDDFESYSTGAVPSPYTAVSTNPPAGVVTTDANSGSQSLNIQGPTATSTFQPTIKKTFSATSSVSELQVAYYEVADSFGGAIRWLSSNGETLCVVGSENPQASVVYGNGSSTRLESSPSPSYNSWRRFTVTPDFASGTFDVLWEDIDGSTGDSSVNGLSFIDNPSDVAEIQFGGEDRTQGSAGGFQQITDTFLVDDTTSLGP